MKSGKLTDVKIRGLKPSPKPVKYPDGGGLYLVVTPAGGKLWRIDYRHGGKRQTLSLGSWPVVGLAEARAKLLSAKRELEAGLNPAATKQARKQTEREEALTLEMAARAFLEYKRENGDSSEAIKGIDNRLKRHIFPALGSRPLKDITAPEILEVLLTVRRLGVDETTLRCRQYIDQIFRHASRKGWIDRNPAADLRGIPELKKNGPVKHHRAVKTPADLGHLLLDIETISDTLAGKALGLAPYVFVRAGELTGARWAEVDLDSSFWRILARLGLQG